MIGSVRGTVIERDATGEVLVEVGGVGYRVLRARCRRCRRCTPGAPAFLFTHLHVREDAMVLYGFPTRDERDTFEALIAATGVGPEARARDPVGAHARRVAALPRRRRSRRAHARARRRQAHRAAAAGRAEEPARGPDLDLGGAPVPRAGARAEVREALTGLGYSPDEVREALGQLPDDGDGRRAAARRAAAAGGGTMTRRAHAGGAACSPTADPVEAAEETTLRPRRLDEFVGQPRLREHLEIMLTAAAAARSGRRPRAARRPARASARRRLAGIIAAEMGAPLPADERARARTRRRPRRDPHQPRRRRRAVHRRDPPPAAPGRGGALSRDGGLPARHRHRQGPVGALDPPRPAALHARRRDHPHRPHHRSAARPLRLRRPARLLRPRRAHRDPRARRADPRRRRSTPRAHARSRGDRAARRASPTGC